MMALFKFLGLFTFSMAAPESTRVVSLLYGVQLFVVVWRHFHVARLSFEEILNT